MGVSLIEQLQKGVKLKKIPHELATASPAKKAASAKSLEPNSFAAKKSTLSGMKMAARSLEVVTAKVYQPQIDALYADCQENTRPLEKYRDALGDDLRFIDSTESHLRKKGKLTDSKAREHEELRQNINARRRYAQDKITQFREEHHEVLERENLRSSINKKLEDLSLEDLHAIGDMLTRKNKPLSSMVVTEARPEVAAGGIGSSLLSAISGFNRGTLKKVTPGEKSSTQSLPASTQKSTKPTLGIKIKNPYQELLNMNHETAAKELEKKSTKELRELKTRIVELNAQLLKEFEYATIHGNKDAAVVKKSQLKELSEVMGIADNTLKDRREIERKKSELIQGLQGRIQPLDGDDLQALNTLLKNSGSKRLSECIDLTGEQLPPAPSPKVLKSATSETSSFAQRVAQVPAAAEVPGFMAASVAAEAAHHTLKRETFSAQVLRSQFNDLLKQPSKNTDAIKNLFKAANAKGNQELLISMLNAKDSSGKYAMAYLKPQDLKEIFNLTFSDELGEIGKGKRMRREAEVLKVVHKHLVDFGVDTSWWSTTSWLGSSSRLFDKIGALMDNVYQGKRSGVLIQKEADNVLDQVLAARSNKENSGHNR